MELILNGRKSLKDRRLINTLSVNMLSQMHVNCKVNISPVEGTNITPEAELF